MGLLADASILLSFLIPLLIFIYITLLAVHASRRKVEGHVAG